MPPAPPTAAPARPAVRPLRRAAVLGGDRTPFSRAGRALAGWSARELMTAALDGLAARHGLAGQRLDAVVAGAVLRHSRDTSWAREAVLGSVLDPRTPAVDLGMACATGLEAAVVVADAIATGRAEVGVAGGADSASDAPAALDDGLRRVLLATRAARTPAARARALARLRPGMLRPALPRGAEPRTGLSMGEHAALTAQRWGTTREDQDALAAASHHALAAAWDRGFFDDLVTPCGRLLRDDVLRPGTSVAALAELAPVFGRELPDEGPGRGRGPTATAGTSTALTDGASAVLLASDAWAAQRSLPVLAHLVDAEAAAVDHVSGADGLLTAPVFALPRLLARTGLELGDFDVVEVHEAFASTVLTTLAAWEDDAFCRARLGRPALGRVDRARLNTAGSSLATGHPFAATGGRVLVTAAKLLAERGGGLALVSVCAAGGQGVVAVLER